MTFLKQLMKYAAVGLALVIVSFVMGLGIIMLALGPEDREHRPSAKADAESLATALESYYVDYNIDPPIDDSAEPDADLKPAGD